MVHCTYCTYYTLQCPQYKALSQLTLPCLWTNWPPIPNHLLSQPNPIPGGPDRGLLLNYLWAHSVSSFTYHSCFSSTFSLLPLSSYFPSLLHSSCCHYSSSLSVVDALGNSPCLGIQGKKWDRNSSRELEEEEAGGRSVIRIMRKRGRGSKAFLDFVEPQIIFLGWPDQKPF